MSHGSFPSSFDVPLAHQSFTDPIATTIPIAIFFFMVILFTLFEI